MQNLITAAECWLIVRTVKQPSHRHAHSLIVFKQNIVNKMEKKSRKHTSEEQHAAHTAYFK